MIKLSKWIKNLLTPICFLFVFITVFNNSYVFASLDGGSDKKNVYLTFDDGPTPGVTEELLDILKKYNVKATFFVVGKEIKGREQILKRIHDEGHSIGLHTYSHNFRKIYSNEDTFIEEILKTSEVIKKVTGCSPNIIRFPGGSSKHLSKKMLIKLHDHNLKVYDWNVSIEDGVNPNLSASRLINKATKCKTDYSRIILLMHCNSKNKNTVKALPEIIEHYKALEYNILPITEDTPEYYYRIKK